MNKEKIAKWLKITFFASLCIFFLNSVNLFDRNIESIMRSLGVWVYFSAASLEEANYNSNYRRIIESIQYLNLAIFLIAIIYLFWRKQNLTTGIIFALFGLLTLFTVVLLSVYKEHFTFKIPLTGGGPSGVEGLTLYISTISAFIASITGLYGQIISGRKALAEVELEKLHLQVEQAKAKSGKKKSTKSRK